MKKSINQILITSSTLSSSYVLKNLNLKKLFINFILLIIFLFFLNYWKPSLAIFIESEIWPYMFKNLQNKKIPLILLNARITKTL